MKTGPNPARGRDGGGLPPAEKAAQFHHGFSSFTRFQFFGVAAMAPGGVLKNPREAGFSAAASSGDTQCYFTAVKVKRGRDRAVQGENSSIVDSKEKTYSVLVKARAVNSAPDKRCDT